MKLGKLFCLMTLILMGGVSASFTSAENNVDNNNELVSIRSKENGKKNALNVEEKYGLLDDNLSVSVSLIASSETSASVSLSSSVVNTGGVDQGIPNSYYIGYTDESDTSTHIRPYLVYEIRNVSGQVEKREAEIVINNTTGYHDLLGSIGSQSVTSTCDIDYLPGEEVLTDEFIVYNYFAAFQDENGRYRIQTDNEGNYVTRYANCSTSRTRNYSFNDYVSMEYVGKSIFDGYGAFEFRATGSITTEEYTAFSSRILLTYNNNQANVLAGKAWIRTRISFTQDTRIHLYYEGETEPEIVTTTIGTVDITEENSKVLILLDNVDASKVVDFKIYGLSLVFDLYDTDLLTRVNGSEQSIRYSTLSFGMADYVHNGQVLIPANEGVYYNNLNLIFGFSVLGFIVIYEGISTFVYFYLKEKNKDDEFKRMRSKSYWSNNTMGLVASGSLFTFLLALIFRSTLAGNSLSVTNPFDVWIIIFGIAAIIFCGYFIKYFAVQIKNIIDKNRNEKLKLNADRTEDGTINIDK